MRRQKAGRFSDWRSLHASRDAEAGLARSCCTFRSGQFPELSLKIQPDPLPALADRCGLEARGDCNLIPRNAVIPHPHDRSIDRIERDQCGCNSGSQLVIHLFGHTE